MLATLSRPGLPGAVTLLLALLLAAPAGSRPAAADLRTTFEAHAPGSRASIDHSAWDALLQRYVVESADGVNRVAYARFKAEAHADLKRYVASLERVDPGKLDRREQMAFWANLYNAKTVDIVLDKFPVASIKDINLGGGLLTLVTGGPWKAKVLSVAGQSLSLDDVEHEILRPIFKDPRVHYSVNCASYGCPSLPREAFTGARLDAQLDAAARAYVNHPRGVAIAGGKVTASSIYSWFQADFGGTDAAVLAHLRTYAAPQLRAGLESVTSIDSYAYDWSLNDLRS